MSVPIRVWNQIAPSMRNRELAAIFSMTSQAQADAALEEWVRRRVDNDPLLVAAFEELAPLLAEHMAIRRWVDLNPQWAGALPEVLTAGEAALLAQADFFLDAPQTERLITHLRML